MFKIRFTPQAVADLDEIKRYIILYARRDYLGLLGSDAKCDENG